ncbi:MAG: MarR family transcriptional regulator [Alphaproteobacteria bacterium]|nr:MarR family transcriptional regulator [Alphaproteobacteria bacterium]
MSPRNDPDHRLLADDLSLDDFLPYLLNRISNRLNTDLSEELRTIGVTLPYWRVLAVLHVKDGRSIGELSVYTITEQSTLSRIVDRMAQARLVERRQAPGDARIAEVFMTDAGRATFDRIMPIAMRHYRVAVDGLTEDEHRVLIEALHKVLATVRATEYP